MKNLLRYTVLIVMLCVLSFLHSASAQSADNQQKVADKDAARLSWYSLKRFSFKTNAVDWFAVIPNFGVEYQLTDNPYKLMTVGLTAKCNWNTFHSNGQRYQPSAVYDVLDIRPEFRYYYRPIPVAKSRTDRTAIVASYNDDLAKSREMLAALRKELLKAKDEKKKEELLKSIEEEKKKIAEKDSLIRTQRLGFSDWFMTNVFTAERKNPRNWRAHYIGGYVNYANYAFKFGERGIRGRNTFGFGAVAGYVLPLYEYNRGAIDIDLGFSVGLQVAKHDVFTHTMDGNIYTRVQEGNSWYGTKYSSDKWLPYPVVSELRVAFVWRKSSIKHSVKTNWKAIEKAEEMKKNEKNFYSDLDLQMSLTNHNKDAFDIEKVDSLPHFRKNDSLYLESYKNWIKEGESKVSGSYIESNVYGFTVEQIEKFSAVIEKRRRDLIDDFEKKLTREKQQAAKGKDSSEKTSKDKPVKEKPEKDKPEKEKTPKEKVPKDKTPKEKTPKEKPEKK